MRDPKSQSGAWHALTRLFGWTAGCTALLAALVMPARRCPAAQAELPVADRTGPEVFGADTPLGRIEYHAGRGLRVGDTGLTVGGFLRAEGQWLERSGHRGGLDGANFLLSYDPLPYVHVFTDLELGQLAVWESGRKSLRVTPRFGVERLYGDFTPSDALNVRLGKFLTPFGRWNLAPADPLVWTASEPVIVEAVFDEKMTGASLWGSVFPGGRALTYSLYGTFLDPITADPNVRTADHSAGARLEWASVAGSAVGASYFASEARRGPWNHLGGVDALWRPTARVELSGEALLGEGTRAEGRLWGLYAQAVVETVRTLYAVGRYERFDPPGRGQAVHLFDLGLAWVPVYYLRLKADYRFADHFNELAPPGLQMSVSLLF